MVRNNIGEFGQEWMTRLLTFQHQAVATAADVEIQKKLLESEKRRSREQLAHESVISELERGLREKEIGQKAEVSRRRDLLFQDIALYSVISLALLGLVVTGGIFMVKKKKEKRGKKPRG